jgi:hypothetical protein
VNEEGCLKRQSFSELHEGRLSNKGGRSWNIELKTRLKNVFKVSCSQNLRILKQEEVLKFKTVFLLSERRTCRVVR